MLKLVISFGIFTACFIEIFSVQRTEFFNFYPEMTNLVPGHLFVFEREQMSLVRCVTFCLLSQDCAAVFRKSASSVCQGFGNPFLFESRNEISNGTWHVKSGKYFNNCGLVLYPILAQHLSLVFAIVEHKIFRKNYNLVSFLNQITCIITKI